MSGLDWTCRALRGQRSPAAIARAEESCRAISSIRARIEQLSPTHRRRSFRQHSQSQVCLMIFRWQTRFSGQIEDMHFAMHCENRDPAAQETGRGDGFYSSHSMSTFCKLAKHILPVRSLA